MIRRNPAFAVVVILVLALGIGGNTAVFSVVNAVVLKPLPYKDVDRIVIPWKKNKEGMDFGMSGQALTLLRENNRTFEHIAGIRGKRVYVEGIEQPQEVMAMTVSPCIFDLLGTRPLMGQCFEPAHEQPGSEQVVVLSHAAWKDYFAGAPDVLGKTLHLVTTEFKSGKMAANTTGYTVIGVMPPDFAIPSTRSAPFWMPLISDQYPVRLLAQLREGVTLEQGRADMTLMTAGLIQLNPAYNEGMTTGVDRLEDRLLGGNDKILLLLWGAAGFVLLITCSTAANLFLARAVARRREMATREALGASRIHLVRQMLTESLIMSLAAGILGVFVTFCTIKGLVGLCPVNIPRLDQTHVDPIVLSFALGLSVLTGLIFGLIPAWSVSGISVGQTLKDKSMSSRPGRCWRRLRSSLVVGQIGISLMLLVGAFLLIRSLIALQAVDLGFDPHNTLAMHIRLPQAKYLETRQCQAFFSPLLEHVGGLPEVRAAALVTPGLDWGTSGAYIDIRLDDRPLEPEKQQYARWMAVTPEFFDAMGIELLRGRTFTDRDIQIGRSSGVIIDENLAGKYFPDSNPLDHKINEAPIIGIVRTIKDFNALSPVHCTYYMPLHAGVHFQNMDLVVRSDGDPMPLAPALRAQVTALDKNQKVAGIETLEETLTEMLAPRRFTMILLGLFASMALILAAAGLYGLLQYSTMQQTHDIGIRMAVGARDMDILKNVLRHGLKLTLVGIIIGIIGALAITRVLSSLLYDVTPTDPVTLAGVSIALGSIALLASFLPARRAARIDPMEALRYE